MAIIGFVNTNLDKMAFVWTYVAVGSFAIIGILYCNISKQFLQQPLEETTEPL